MTDYNGMTGFFTPESKQIHPLTAFKNKLNGKTGFFTPDK